MRESQRLVDLFEEFILAIYKDRSSQDIEDSVAKDIAKENLIEFLEEQTVPCHRCLKYFPNDPKHFGYPDVHECV